MVKSLNSEPGNKQRPTIKNMVTQSIYYNPVPSPDGKKVAYTEILPDLINNTIIGRCYIFDSESERTFRAFEDGIDFHWLDESTFSVVRHSPSESPRWSDIYLVENLIGEGIRIVSHQSRITKYAPFAEGFIYLANKDNGKSRIGNIVHVESEQSKSALFYVSIEGSIKNQERNRTQFKEEELSNPPSIFEITRKLAPEFHITSFVHSQSTNSIYLNCQIGIDLIYERDTVSFKIKIDPEAVLKRAEDTGLEDAVSLYSLERLALPKGFKVSGVSPNGSTLLLEGPVPGASKQPRSDLWLISDKDACDSDKSEDAFVNLKLISEKLDRHPLDVHWTKKGIFVLHWEESSTVISKLSESGEYKTYVLGKVSPRFSISINDKGDAAFSGFSPTKLPEVYIGSLTADEMSLLRITRNTERYAHLDFGTVESIRWTSQDGTEIEGILRKPSGFDPSKKYPLIIFPHGGPRVSTFLSLYSNDYMRPVHPLLAKGILILEPNYRGGLGKGREFMNLNYDNMGIGDMWDIESGIDHLVAQGFVDETKIGSMGGSQGGYLSAYIAMHTDRCAAVSVNAGVSSWYMYYISSDSRHTIHLEGTPFQAESHEAYRKSAPISGIKTANTPMLLQHGDKDERISVVSAQELYRALKHKGVSTELFVLPDKGHGYFSPRENYAILLQNYRWFCHYLLGEELDFFKDDF
jgi:dienelactone hydrolase